MRHTSPAAFVFSATESKADSLSFPEPRRRTPRALDDFCRDAHPLLVAAFDHYFGDRWLAEELAQEALIKVCQRWPTVREMASPIGWAYHVGRNVGRSRLRRVVIGRRARARAAGVEDGVHVDPDTPDRVAVQSALGRLSPAQRDVVVLRSLIGLSTAETALALGISADAVRARSSRAMAEMRRHLDTDQSSPRTTEAHHGR